MDISEALEDMVATAPDIYDQTFQPYHDSIKRWQTLFNYTPLKAAERIKDQKLNGCPLNLTSSQWEMIRSEKEAQGHDRDSYEHWIETHCHRRSTPDETPHPSSSDPPIQSSTAIYLVKLTPLLPTASKIQEIAHLPDLPPTHAGTSSTSSPALFCRIDGTTLHALRTWLLTHGPSHNLTTVRLTLAAKDLSPNSIYPTLGHDATLPHHRPPTPSLTAGQVMQHDYPVLYFFYGFLPYLERLTHLLSRPTITSHTPNLVPATVKGGKVEYWRGKYKALVDGGEGDVVEGVAFEVEGGEEEEALRFFETEMYEVVRCGIRMGGGGGKVLGGLTFRFARREQLG